MKKDLSKDPYSATAVYQTILSQLKNIRDLEIDENLKTVKGLQLIDISLTDKMNEAKANNKKGISKNYIDRTMNNLRRCYNINGIISYVITAINKGKNYEKENN